MANKIQLRRDTAANWTAFNPVLADGEIGIETDTFFMKFGDGIAPWNERPYLRFPGTDPGQQPPVNTAVPVITGTAQEGQTISASPGTWTGAQTFAYQWRRNGGAISGATASSYAVGTADVGATLSVAVTAGNSAGNATANSAPTATVIAASGGATAPVNTAAPTISGTAQVGSTLTSTTGSWSGSPTPTYARQWLRNGADISGATSATYQPVTGDIGATISVRVTAANSAGSASATSAATAAVTAAPADSRARFGYGSATAGVTGPEALLASMTVFGSANASKTGAFTSAPPSGQYVWAAFEADASSAGVTFTVALGPGGWQGASSSGPNFDDPGSSPNTSTVTAVINGVTWRFFRTSFANAADAWTTS